MNAEDRELVLSATKHLTTLATASMAFLITMLFTYFKGTPYILSAEVSLGLLLISVLLGALIQLMVVTEALGDRVMFSWINVKTFLFLAWTFLVAGISALVVSLWANLHL